MLDIDNEKLKYESIKHAQLLMWIANAPHVQRKDKKPWELSDFLPDYIEDERIETPEDIERMFMSQMFG